MNCLPQNKQLLVSQMLASLADIEGIEAIALGGSYARGVATDASDIDLGIYYSEASPPSIDQIRNLARTFDSTPHLIVTNFYEWGQWVNGGAWLNTSCGEVDWLYRNLDQVEKVIEEAMQGKFAWDFRQQPPHGFFSVSYLADLRQNIILYDPKGKLAWAKQAIQAYPQPLKKALVQGHLWSIEFTSFNAKKFLKRNCLYGTVGCINRMIAELTQVLFALNEIYFATDKDILSLIDTFAIKPRDYSQRIHSILCCPGKDQALAVSLKQLQEIIQETMALAHPLYTSKYAIE
ncbi:nucleotidyltransferase domain-containing protein [Candidatus Protochlamydia phocaeensis]|uniref:nucleotidyltransferase domain-containing protein n=1 Tax=Candidatus Protochlamydia phocaeensis TaxID=1414722 RepID=UPI000838A756|nr:nucleotidyltransferase domain-containing protein [Candidatus Protochlamydia phocaeensis]